MRYKVDKDVICTFMGKEEVIIVTRSNITAFNQLKSRGPDRQLKSMGSDKPSIKFQFKETIVSAWINDKDKVLSVLSTKSLTLISMCDWSLISEHMFHDLNSMSPSEEPRWVCSVPGPWLSDHTDDMVTDGNLEVMALNNCLKLFNVKQNQVSTIKCQRNETRGQFLSQFMMHFGLDAKVTSLSNVVSLLSTSLKCQYLNSSISDLQWSKTMVIILTTEGQVWRISRDGVQIKQVCLIQNASSICLHENQLFVHLQDGAVYKFDETNNEEFSAIFNKVPGRGSKDANEQTKELQKLGEASSKLKEKVKQLQTYQFLLKCTELENIFVTTCDVDNRNGALMCQFKILSPKVELRGNFWSLKLETLSTSNQKVTSTSVSLPDALSSFTEPVIVHLKVPNEDPPSNLNVRFYLNFKSELVQTNRNIKLFPPVYLSEKKVPLLDFLFLVGENVGEQKINSLESNLISSLDSIEEKLHRLKVSVKKTNIPTDNKIGQFIVKSEKSYVILKYFSSEVRVKSDYVKKTDELLVNIESKSYEVFELLDCYFKSRHDTFKMILTV